MARLQDAGLPSRAVTPLRLAMILIFLCTLSGCALYLAGGSLRMVYWGGERLSQAQHTQLLSAGIDQSARRPPAHDRPCRLRRRCRPVPANRPVSLVQYTAACGPWFQSRICCARASKHQVCQRPDTANDGSCGKAQWQYRPALMH